MCRVLHRPMVQSPLASVVAGQLLAQEPQAPVKEEDDLDFESLFDDATPVELDAELLNLINGVQEHNAGEATSTVVSAPTFLAPAQTGLHGLQGLAQLPMAQGMHQYAVPMNDAAMFAAPLPPMQPATQMGVYAEALLHQQQQLMAQSPEEAAAQEERIKRRRRESAQRSRQRKSCYMKTLEVENDTLKAQVALLQKELKQMRGGSDGAVSRASSIDINNASDALHHSQAALGLPVLTSEGWLSSNAIVM